MSECVGHACVLTNYFYAAFTRRFACRANTGPANHNGTSAQTHFANILLAAFTMRLQTGKNQYYGNHNGSHAQNRRGPSGDHARPRPFCSLWILRPSLDTAERAGPAATTRAADPHAASGHCGESRPSGDHARRRPFCSLWTLRREPATAERAGPAATTRAAGPSAVSGHCGESRPSGDHARRRESRPSGDHARHRPFCSLWTLRREPAQRRPRAPQALLQSLDTAERAGPAATTRAAGPSAVSGHCGESRPSGDHARHGPFCSLWTLRREPAQRRPRAPQALLQSLDTAERAGPAATTRAADPHAASGHCGESRPSGDHARRRPFCSLCTLRREPAQRRPRAPQALLQSLDTAERAGPAATTRAAGPSAVSGHCGEPAQRRPRASGHCGESRPSGDHARRRPSCSLWTLRREPAQRRPRAPQALLQSLDTAERAGHCRESRPSSDHARRRPSCSLWTLWREPAQRRPRAPQALLQSLDTAERAGPAATTRATGSSAVSGHCGESRPSGDHARRRPFCSLWTLRREPAQRRPRAPQALLQSLDTVERAGPAATTRAAGPSAVSGHCGESRPSGDHARQSLDTAERAGPAATTRAAGPSAVSGHCGESRPSGDHARRRPSCSLWTLWREPAQRRPRAPQALLQSLDTAERAGPAATTRATGPSAVSGHCGESRPSGDHARRRPFCSLWTLRREPAQRRPRAPQTLMQPLDTVERAGPAATTRAAGPSAVSGHCGESRPSGDHARRRPFCSLWTLRREPAQRRPRAPQALLQSLDTAGPSAVSSVME